MNNFCPKIPPTPPRSKQANCYIRQVAKETFLIYSGYQNIKYKEKKKFGKQYKWMQRWVGLQLILCVQHPVQFQLQYIVTCSWCEWYSFALEHSEKSMLMWLNYIWFAGASFRKWNYNTESRLCIPHRINWERQPPWEVVDNTSLHVTQPKESAQTSDPHTYFTCSLIWTQMLKLLA